MDQVCRPRVLQPADDDDDNDDKRTGIGIEQMIKKPFLTKDDQTHNALLVTNFEKLQNKVECQPMNILSLDGCFTDYHSPIISHSWGGRGHESTKTLQGYPEGCRMLANP